MQILAYEKVGNYYVNNIECHISKFPSHGSSGDVGMQVRSLAENKSQELAIFSVTLL